MSVAIGALLGVLLGVGLAVPMARRMDRAAPPARPGPLAWTAFGLGVAANALLASALFLPLALPGPQGSAVNSAQLSAVLSAAGVTTAAWALAKRDRHWVSWTAVIIAPIPTLFWLLFALGYLLEVEG